MKGDAGMEGSQSLRLSLRLRSRSSPVEQCRQLGWAILIEYPVDDEHWIAKSLDEVRVTRLTFSSKYGKSYFAMPDLDASFMSARSRRVQQDLPSRGSKQAMRVTCASTVPPILIGFPLLGFSFIAELKPSGQYRFLVWFTRTLVVFQISAVSILV
jgi:hypothetical protein